MPSEDSDQPGRMPRLIWVFVGHTLILLVLSCCGSSVDASWEASNFVRIHNCRETDKEGILWSVRDKFQQSFIETYIGNSWKSHYQDHSNECIYQWVHITIHSRQSLSQYNSFFMKKRDMSAMKKMGLKFNQMIKFSFSVANGRNREMLFCDMFI